jgi:hypothetical protein
MLFPYKVLGDDDLGLVAVAGIGESGSALWEYGMGKSVLATQCAV